jgi:general stress protein YciG
MPDNYSDAAAATTPDGAPATAAVRPKSRRGFASMDPQRQREIARLGGRASHASGNAHEFTSEEARAAGRKSHQGQPGRGRSVDAQASANPAPGNGAS